MNRMPAEYDYFLRAYLYNKDKSSINSYLYKENGERYNDILLNPIAEIEKKFPRSYFEITLDFKLFLIGVVKPYGDKFMEKS